MKNKRKDMSYWGSAFYMIVGTVFASLGFFVSMPINFFIGGITTLLGIVTFIFGYLNLKPEF